MRIFLDTEFHEAPGSIELISIGLVADNGAEYYAESSDYDTARAHPWLAEHVIPHLMPVESRKSRGMIAAEVHSFVRRVCGWNYHDPHVSRDSYPVPEFWGFYADYDWVVFCWLFGTMKELPEGYPMYCRDLKQWADALGNPKLPKPPPDDRHVAIQDARYVRIGYHHLREIEADSDPDRDLPFGQRLGRMMLDEVRAGMREGRSG